MTRPGRGAVEEAGRDQQADEQQGRQAEVGHVEDDGKHRSGVNHTVNQCAPPLSREKGAGAPGDQWVESPIGFGPAPKDD
jgi:hypothetical protein